MDDSIGGVFYMVVQGVIIAGYCYCQPYGYWYLLGSILVLSSGYVVFMRKYFHLLH